MSTPRVRPGRSGRVPHRSSGSRGRDSATVRQFVFHSVFHGNFVPRALAWEWVVAHVFGATKRWFEGPIAAHWGFRDAAEVLLLLLRDHWMRERPDVPFPLDEDEEGQGQLRLGYRLLLRLCQKEKPKMLKPRRCWRIRATSLRRWVQRWMRLGMRLLRENCGEIAPKG
jgi:hypothetical protein